MFSEQAPHANGVEGCHLIEETMEVQALHPFRDSYGLLLCVRPRSTQWGKRK